MLEKWLYSFNFIYATNVTVVMTLTIPNSECLSERCEYCTVIYMQVTHHTSVRFHHPYTETERHRENDALRFIYEVIFIFLGFGIYSVCYTLCYTCNVCVVSTYAIQVPCVKYRWTSNNNKENNSICCVLSDNDSLSLSD